MTYAEVRRLHNFLLRNLLRAQVRAFVFKKLCNGVQKSTSRPRVTPSILSTVGHFALKTLRKNICRASRWPPNLSTVWHLDPQQIDRDVKSRFSLAFRGSFLNFEKEKDAKSKRSPEGLPSRFSNIVTVYFSKTCTKCRPQAILWASGTSKGHSRAP